MSTTSQIQIAGITVDVVRKDIKHLHLAVYPPTGRVRIAAPLRTSEDSIRLFAVSKLRWIRRHQKNFREQPRQSPREYVGGESHYFQGRRYRLRIHERRGRNEVIIKNRDYIDLYVRPGATREQRARVLREWYRRELKALIPGLITKWESRMGVQVADWGVKSMRTQWGSCNIEARRIWLNLELAKHPLDGLEYVIVHEMTHLLERHHNKRFRGLLDAFLPGWEALKARLNNGLL